MPSFCSAIYGRFAVVGLLSLTLVSASLQADKKGQELESGIEGTDKEYVLPVLEYSFKQDLEHASPLDYRSVKASGLPLALRHRIDAIWSGSAFFIPLDQTASDFPFVAEVQYRLRRSPWSDPERMVEARLLDGTQFQALVTREFGMGREYEMSAALQHAESVLANDDFDTLEQTSLPVELRAEIGQNTDFIAGAEFKSSRLNADGDLSQSTEQSIKMGLGSELAEGFYGQITAGGRNSQLDRNRSETAAEMDAALIWQVGADSQYSLTFNRSTRPSLIADDFVKAETVSFAGDFTLSGMWSAYYGVSKSWMELEPTYEKELYSGEVAVSFSPSQSISFSGGYIFRSGSLSRVQDDEAEQIIRLSATLSY